MLKYVCCAALAVCVVAVRGALPVVEVAPAGTTDRTAAVMAAVDAVRRAGGGTVRFVRGAYHFRTATPQRFYISNHDNFLPRAVFLSVTNVHDVVFAGDETAFVFHGGCDLGLMLRDTARVSVRGIAFDYARPFCSETTFLRFDGNRPVVFVDDVRFPCALEGGILHAVGEGLKEPVRRQELFALDTHEYYGWCPSDGRATALGNGEYRLETDWKRAQANRVPRAGDVFHLRSTARPNPAILLYRADDTLLEDCVVRAAPGMGLIAQRCANVTVRGRGTARDRTAGAFPRHGSGRMTSLQADATHFSNCRGTVTVENCYFECMVDDAINVHSTCLQIEKVLPGNRLLCRYKHPQAVGFEVFRAGETLRYINARTLEENYPLARVTAVSDRAFDLVELAVSAPLPKGVAEGDAVENADWQPAAIFRGNIVRNNRPRATLFTTPGRVVCESNLFERTSAQAIHLEADACNWYESGACRDIVIRGNVFRNCMTCGGRGVIQIWPNVKDPAAQKSRYHRNIVIEDNVFEQFPSPLLAARCVSNLVWRANVVKPTQDYRARPERTFIVEHSEDVRIDAEGEGAK